MNEDKKILIVTSIALNEVGGPAKIFSWLISKLDKEKKPVKIVELSHQKKVYSNPLVNLTVKIITFTKSITKLLLSVKGYDIIFATDAVGAGLPSLIIAKIFRKKFYVRVGGDQVWERFFEFNNSEQIDLVTFFETKKYKDKWFIYLIAKYTLTSAEKVLVPSQLLADVLINYYFVKKENITIINNIFVGQVVQTQKKFKLNKKFLFAGRLINMKNILFLTECFLEAKLDGWQLLIAGAGYQEAELKKMIEKSNDAVVFLGYKTRDELREIIYKQVDCLLLPSMTDIFPNGIMESLVNGLPGAVSKYTGFTDEIKNSLYTFASIRDKKIFIEDLNRLTKLEVINDLLEKMNKINWENYSEDKALKEFKKFMYD